MGGELCSEPVDVLAIREELLQLLYCMKFSLLFKRGGG